jgi:hypothetical protein
MRLATGSERTEAKGEVAVELHIQFGVPDLDVNDLFECIRIQFQPRSSTVQQQPNNSNVSKPKPVQTGKKPDQASNKQAQDRNLKTQPAPARQVTDKKQNMASKDTSNEDDKRSDEDESQEADEKENSFSSKRSDDRPVL